MQAYGGQRHRIPLELELSELPGVGAGSQTEVLPKSAHTQDHFSNPAHQVLSGAGDKPGFCPAGQELYS